MPDPASAEARWRRFCWLCQALRAGLGEHRSELLPAWPDDADEAEALVALAGGHLVTPALAIALRGNPTVPPQVSDYLEAALYLNRLRNAALLDDLVIAADALAAKGIVPVVLKGAANLLDDLYPDPGMRILHDLDLLVPQESAPRAADALAEAGFDHFEAWTGGPVRFWRHHHLPAQQHRRSGNWIELHYAPVPLYYANMLDAARAQSTAVDVAFRGRTLRILDPTARVAHNIVHDQLSDGSYLLHRTNIRQLLDLMLICRRHAPEIDLNALRAAFPGRRWRVTAFALGLTALLGGTPIGGVPDAAASRLRDGIMRPRAFLRIELRNRTRNLLLQPSLLRNYWVPGKWGKWLRTLWRLSKSPAR